jgi:hypothetical protein
MTITNGQVANADDVLAGYGAPFAQLAFSQVKMDDTTWDNADYLGADIFTAAAGAKSTIDTTNSTGDYESAGDYLLSGDYNSLTELDEQGEYHDLGARYTGNGWTNESNFRDGDFGTAANYNIQSNRQEYNLNSYAYLGDKFSEVYIYSVKYKASAHPGSGNYHDGSLIKVELQSYTGASWITEHSESATGEYPGDVDVDTIVSLNKNVQGLRVKTTINWDAGSYDRTVNENHIFYELQYFTEYDTSSTVETNTIIDDIIPDSIVVYGKTDIPTDTSITVDVSDDGGTTWSLTDKELNTAIDTSTFTTGNLALKFNLATTDTSKTPKLYGYGVAITDT